MVTRPMRSERSKQFDWNVISVFLYLLWDCSFRHPIDGFFPQKEVFVEEIDFFSSAKIFLNLFSPKVENFLS
jgi:hypothetical protein